MNAWEAAGGEMVKAPPATPPPATTPNAPNAFPVKPDAKPRWLGVGFHWERVWSVRWCCGGWRGWWSLHHLAASGLPSVHPAEQGTRIFVTGFLQEQRRTGARVFSRSGT